MRCQYTFPVRGKLLVAHAHPVTVDGWRYEFLREGERIVAFRVSVPFPEGHPLPSATPPAAGKPAHFEFVSPLYDEVLSVARATFGLLAFHQPCDIDTALAETVYVPESEAERQRLPVYSIRMHPPDPFNVRVSYRHLLRALLAARTASRFEQALSFLRLGQLAFQERRYIEAIYNFFFVLESQFGNGKSGNKALEKAFLASPLLVSRVEELVSEPDSFLAQAKGTWAASPRAVLVHFISLRGRLHHHSAASSVPWHPESHQAYQLECACLAEVATTVMIHLAGTEMFTPETKRRVAELCPHEPEA